MIVDSHQHFWQLSRGDYVWPNESVAPIFRDFAPADLAPHLAEAGVRQTVLVQATDSVAETCFLLDLAAQHDVIAGVVGWVDLRAPDAVATIDSLRSSPWLKGLRPMLQSIADTDWILRDAVQPALAHMQNVGLRFDALVQPRHLDPLATMATRYPGLAMVIDHLAKPVMGNGQDPDPDWRDGIGALAALPNVWCKLSGMVTEIGPDWRQEDLAPFAQAVMTAFGPDRVMWGSDWPVVNLAADYATWFATAKRLVGHLSEDDRGRVFGHVARAFYRL